MNQYAGNNKTVSEAVGGGGLLVVAQWEAKEGQADKVAAILDDFLPEAQKDPGAKLFLIGRNKDNPAQFLFYELFRDDNRLHRVARRDGRVLRPQRPRKPWRSRPKSSQPPHFDPYRMFPSKRMLMIPR